MLQILAQDCARGCHWFPDLEQVQGCWRQKVLKSQSLPWFSWIDNKKTGIKWTAYRWGNCGAHRACLWAVMCAREGQSSGRDKNDDRSPLSPLIAAISARAHARAHASTLTPAAAVIPDPKASPTTPVYDDVSGFTHSSDHWQTFACPCHLYPLQISLLK